MDDTTHTLRTFFDGCALTLRCEGDTAHFEFWFPKKSEPHWIATLPAIGGAISWAPSVGEIIKDYDEGKEEMGPDGCLEDIRSIVEDFAALPGDRRGYTWNDTSGFWEVSNKPLVIARDEEQLSIVTYRDDSKAGYIGWRIHWDGDEHSAPSTDDAPAVYHLVETCSQQYSKECGAPTYGTQVWRIEQGKVTHDAWFAWASDPAKAVKELCDLYSVAGWDGAEALPSVDPDSLRVVESADNACCYLVY